MVSNKNRKTRRFGNCQNLFNVFDLLLVRHVSPDILWPQGFLWQDTLDRLPLFSENVYDSHKLIALWFETMILKNHFSRGSYFLSNRQLDFILLTASFPIRSLYGVIPSIGLLWLSPTDLLVKFQGYRQRCEGPEASIAGRSFHSAIDQPDRTLAGRFVERPSCLQSQRQRDTRAQSK